MNVAHATSSFPVHFFFARPYSSLELGTWSNFCQGTMIVKPSLFLLRYRDIFLTFSLWAGFLPISARVDKSRTDMTRIEALRGLVMFLLNAA